MEDVVLFYGGCNYFKLRSSEKQMCNFAKYDASVNDDAKKKPEFIYYHNKTKDGVNVMDQIVSTYM